jgi:CBS domain-containing protein
MKTCRDVMTSNPTCCLASVSVQEAAQMMRSEDIGSVPVVENHDDKRLVGIVTDRDLALKVVGEARDARSTRVENVMTRDVVTCRPNDSLEKAMDAMAHHQVRRIPVVDDSGRVVGIIAQADIALRVDSQSKTGEVVEEISKPA